jgi:hypothetical protein
MKEEEF